MIRLEMKINSSVTLYTILNEDPVEASLFKTN